MNFSINLDKFFECLQKVETGGEPKGGVGCVNRLEGSYGPLQIRKCFLQDANEFLHARIPIRAVRDNFAISKVIAYAYYLRYKASREALLQNDWQTLARIHNGGPRGHKKKSTLAYWKKVEKELIKKAQGGES